MTDQPDPNDFSGRYNTQLSAEDEAKFQAWALANNRQGDSYDYDMRGAWKAGAPQASNGHFPDTFKKPNHPTFSVESKYNGADGAQGGTWVKDAKGNYVAFVPSKTNIATHGVDGLRDYFKREEPDVQLKIPDAQLFYGRSK